MSGPSEVVRDYRQRQIDAARESVPVHVGNCQESLKEVCERIYTCWPVKGNPGDLSRLDKAALLGLAEMLCQDARCLRMHLEEAVRPDIRPKGEK